MDACESPCWCWELNPGLLEEQPGLFTAELPFSLLLSFAHFIETNHVFHSELVSRNSMALIAVIKRTLGQTVVVLALIPVLGWKRQADLCEFEFSLVYIASSRTARAT